MKYGSLQEFIEDLEYSYCVTNTRLYGENSVRRFILQIVIFHVLHLIQAFFGGITELRTPT